MKNTAENKEKAFQYLFGELAEADRDEFEERLFTDEDFGLFVNDVENDLIDEYLRGELEFVEKRRFESRYLTAESRREKVALARTLHTKVFETKAETVVSETDRNSVRQYLAAFFRFPNPAFTGGLAIVVLLLLLGGIWLARQFVKNDHIAANRDTNQPENVLPPQNSSPEHIISNTNKTPENDSNTNLRLTPAKENPTLPEKTMPPKPETPKPKQKSPEVKQPPKVFAFSLLPPVRSSENPTLSIPSAAQTVHLRLFDNFGQKYEKFIVELNDGNGRPIWSREIKASQAKPQKSITVNIPNTKFKSGNYEIVVSGVTKEGSVEEISFYNFVVQRK